MDRFDFAALRLHYASFDMTCYGSCFREGGGIFVPSKLDVLFEGFNVLKDKGFVNESDLIVDAGSGDGRVVALLNCMGFRSFGIERDSKLVEASLNHFLELSRFIGFSRHIPRVSCGNFISNDPYHFLGISFERVNLFFNYMNGYEDLARTIKDRSPNGTRMVLLSGTERPFAFNGLHNEDIICVDGQDWYQRSFFHVYRK